MRKLKNSELERVSPEEFEAADKIPCIVVLDNLRSHNNIGSIFRTADAFVVEAVFLCGITACPPHRDIHKTALGASETVRWQYFDETETAVKQLKSDGYMVYAVEQVEGAIPLERFILPVSKPVALIFGHEIKGVDQQIVNLADGSIEIPQFGTKHSLNVAVSAGIAIWEVFKMFTKKS